MVAATQADPRPAGHAQPNVQVLWRRLAALLLDSFVVFLLQGSITRLAVPIHVRVNHPGALHGSVSLGFAAPGLSLGWLIVTTIVYFAFFEALLAATPGKLLARLRVVDRTGRRVTVSGAVGRNLIRPIDAAAGYLVGGLAVLLSRDRRRLGDRAAGTLVAADESLGWVDRSIRAVIRVRLLSFGGLVLLLVALTAASALHAPAMTPALNEGFYPVSGMVSEMRLSGARSLTSMTVAGPRQDGTRASYELRYRVRGKRSYICRMTASFGWDGLLSGWTFHDESGSCDGTAAR